MEMRGREQVYRMSTRSGFLREGFVVQLLLRFANLLASACDYSTILRLARPSTFFFLLFIVFACTVSLQLHSCVSRLSHSPSN